MSDPVNVTLEEVNVEVVDDVVVVTVSAVGPQGPSGNFRIEPRTDDPASPEVGQIWLRTDL